MEKLAISLGFDEIVGLMKDATGIVVQERNDKMVMAAGAGNMDVVRTLARLPGGDINHVHTTRNETSLTRAVWYGRRDAVGELITKYSADVNKMPTVCVGRQSVFACAAFRLRVLCLLLLRSRGARHCYWLFVATTLQLFECCSMRVRTLQSGRQ